MCLHGPSTYVWSSQSDPGPANMAWRSQDDMLYLEGQEPFLYEISGTRLQLTRGDESYTCLGD